MKRSQINRHMREAVAFLAEMRTFLPPFAFWTPEEWRGKGAEYDEIRENLLGWDLTDFGSGDFEKIGLLLLTVRNGNQKNPACRKPYAEKLMILNPGQLTPYHYHQSKMEDIINRGGGTLKVQVYGSKSERELDKTSPVPLSVDGRGWEVAPGTVVSLAPGESITLLPGVFHQFWGEGGKLLLGEVSMVNDDFADNFFLEPRGRFPAIEEDESPLYLLANEYPKSTGD